MMARFVVTFLAALLLGLAHQSVSTQSLQAVVKPSDTELFSARIEYGDGLYELSAIKLDWFYAKNLCKSLGKLLVSFETVDESDAIASALIGMRWTDSLWTSGSNHFVESEYYWDSTGLSIAYENWGSEPIRNGDSIYMSNASDFQWNRYSWKEYLYFLCESHPCK